MAGPRSSALLLCVFLLGLLDAGVAAPGDLVYDQRQTGKFNVHVRVQDVGIFAVLGRGSSSDSSQDDVYEDYHDPVDEEETECCDKVSTSTTVGTRATSTTTTTTTTTSTTTPTTTTSSTTPTTTTRSTTPTTTTTVTTPVPSTTKKRKKTTTEATTSNSSPPSTEPTRRRRCNLGYVRDKRGRCRRVQRVTESTFGLRLIPRSTATPSQSR